MSASFVFGLGCAVPCPKPGGQGARYETGTPGQQSEGQERKHVAVVSLVAAQSCPSDRLRTLHRPLGWGVDLVVVEVGSINRSGRDATAAYSGSAQADPDRFAQSDHIGLGGGIDRKPLQSLERRGR